VLRIKRYYNRFTTNPITIPYVLIIHEVADYAAWKIIFDQASAIRKNAGERSYQVLQHGSSLAHL
jgi:hypothetical protein